MIKRLELKNFTVFDELCVDFSPKINIIIGENGSGKTHLMKAAYALCATPDIVLNRFADVSYQDVSALLTKKITDVFLPLDNKIAKLRKTGASGGAELLFVSSNDHKIECSFNTNSQQIKVINNIDYERYSYEPVYIPTKEVLSFMEGFTSLYEKYQLSYDRTYFDICNYLDLPKAREERLSPKAQWAMDEIQKTIGGKFIFHGGGRITFQSAMEEYSVNAMAEGYRKIGMLSRLLETGAILPGGSGPLFWDEPETNMNPQLLKLLVQILLELARNGQQIIITTHDYALLKWFDLLADKDNGDHISYFSLSKDNASGGVSLEKTESFAMLNKNAISNTFAEIYDEEVKRALK